ncbi:MAG: asparagine synthase (glutamine-hydrolyzing) [Acidobacteria bacterium]|nr:MAG: asparagine synthase (glutamine-hydrolyzing) [Acidobacteriota bacterium]
MCGICGVFNFDRKREVQRSWLDSMNRQIVHRGPDDDGFFVSENVGLAMRRLSIIDLETGHQPLSNEDGAIWVVYNGEIYNYKDLRSKLLNRGHTFRSNTDTEVIVHLYEEYGRNCVEHLRGMFAFVVWDKGRRRLFAARDRLGIKPFYYRLTDREFIFASEIKSLLEFPGVKHELNRASLPEYLAFGYLTSQETLFSGINSLPPARWLELDESGNASLQEYWDLHFEVEREHPEKCYVETYRTLFEECVASHLMSDVPVGVFLSGGLDSSAVAAMTAKHSREPLQTFSVGYDESCFSELPYARAVAEHIGSQHHQVVVRCEDFFAALPRLIWHEDKPIAWPSSVALYSVARLAREHVVVVLTGEGSDETLAGYSRYVWTLWNARFDSVYRWVLPRSLRSFAHDFISNTALLNADTRRRLQHTFVGRNGDSWNSLYLETFLCAFGRRERDELLLEAGGDFSRDPYRNYTSFWESKSGDLLSRMLYADIKTYLVELLMKQDRMSMAASVESRVPFLDHVLVEFAARVPSRYRIHRLGGKNILRSAVRDLLPSSIIDRRKMGFPTPWSAWLSGPKAIWIEQLLTEPRSRARGLFKPETVRQILHEHNAGRRDHTDHLWRLLNLELWHRIFVDADPDYLVQIESVSAPVRS